jgi:hypothetical protein
MDATGEILSVSFAEKHEMHTDHECHEKGVPHFSAPSEFGDTVLFKLQVRHGDQ